ncbi:MAG: MotA/TolQ/ExbB proton channel family protein [Candidatus Electrothrix scaldis]|nr:MAG: MotA/TolQ/ExbB proton channel family protein [Candidatus Electrothrix sp. GW3-3]
MIKLEDSGTKVVLCFSLYVILVVLWMPHIAKFMKSSLFLMVSVILFMLFGLFISIKNNQSIKNIASLMTSIGILGTFVGVTYGLILFDPNNIEQSVPKLLDGLKTAFVTSVIGLLINCILKIVSTFEKKV